MQRHILVTNDFPPKVGGIQNKLFELWKRLDPASFVVLTCEHPDSGSFDSSCSFPIERIRGPLLPSPRLKRVIRSLVTKYDIGFAVYNPALPTSAIAPYVGLPYLVMLHGAEVAVPARLPLLSIGLSRLLAGSEGLICGGSYPVALAKNSLARRRERPELFNVPPGIDLERFHPPTTIERERARGELGVKDEEKVVLFVSRLVPRKGADTLIRAVGDLQVSLRESTIVWVVGQGRDLKRLEKIAASTKARVEFMGAPDDASLVKIYAAADIFAMLSRDRWLGLEKEGFGIVFLEAQASGLPVLVGASGGSGDTIEDGRGGYLVPRPKDRVFVRAALENLLSDSKLRHSMGQQARAYVETNFNYEDLVVVLQEVLSSVQSSL